MSGSTFQIVSAGLLGIVLVGCDSGSSSSDPKDDEGNDSLATLSGRAAVGAPIAGASVEARCAGESGFTNSVNTDSGGRFEGQVRNSSLPCALRVDGGTEETRLHSYSEAAGNVNITPLTDLIIAVTTADSPGNWYDQSERVQRAQGLADAQEDVLNALRLQGYRLPDGDFDPFRSPFVIGDTADRLLDELMAAVNEMANVDNYAAFVALMSSGNLALLPQAPDPAGTGDGTEDNGGTGGDGGGASAAACLNPLLYQEGQSVEVHKQKYDSNTGSPTGYQVDRRVSGGLVDFRGNTARVFDNAVSESDVIAGEPLTPSFQIFMRLDETVPALDFFGIGFIGSEDGTATSTFWSEPPEVFRYDLAPGESYRQTYTGYMSLGGGDESVIATEFDRTITYSGRETVTVPAGTFETCKFYYEEMGDDGGGIIGIEWMSVGDGVPVQDGLSIDGEEMITAKLQSYSINGVQQAP